MNREIKTNRVFRLMIHVIALVITFGLLFSSISTDATVITFDLDYEFSGYSTPAGTPPWLQVTFNDYDGLGSVELKLEDVNLSGSEHVRTWYLNLDPDLDPTALVFTHSYGKEAKSIMVGQDSLLPSNSTYFDILFEFSNEPGFQFGEGDSAIYTITGIPSLMAESFNFPSYIDPKKLCYQEKYYSAAGIIAINTDKCVSSYIATQPVPEPSAMLLLCCSLISLLGFKIKFNQ